MDRVEIETKVRSDERWKKICPRCGRKINGYPAMSRYADVDICSRCGQDEAIRDFAGTVDRANVFSIWFIK